MLYKKIIFLLLITLPLNIYALNKAPFDITKVNIDTLELYLDNNIITSEELVNLYLDRINTYKDYNAIITINENAIKEAQKLDEERLSGKIRSKIHGIPIIVKDNIDVFGMPTTAGAKALNDNYPKEDADVIKRLKAAGAIILAKANMSEFAFQASSSRSSYGTVKNAYNIEYSSYGSSGGSAVSIALSFAAAALGTDTNSSVRVPSSAANIVGYRPTFGSISKEGIMPYDPERDIVGVLSQNISDVITITNIISDNDYNLSLTNLKGITIGVPTSFLKGKDSNTLIENKEIYNDIYNLMIDAISKMEDNGAKIVYLDSYYGGNQSYYVEGSYSGYLFRDSFNNYLKGTTGKIRSFYELTSSNQKITDLSGYAKHCNTDRTLDEKNQLKQKYKNYLEKIYKENNLDVIIYPTTKNKLLKVGKSGLINLSAHASSTVGFPAITMPLGFDQDNLPYGIEFMSVTNEDNKLFNIASIYESLNSNDVKPEKAPNLYNIDKEVSNLLNKYLNNKKIFLKKSWLKKVNNYFNNYCKSDTYIIDAKALIKEYNIKLILRYIINVLLISSILVYLKNRFFPKRKKSKNKRTLRRKRYYDRLHFNRRR